MVTSEKKTSNNNITKKFNYNHNNTYTNNNLFEKTARSTNDFFQDNCSEGVKTKNTCFSNINDFNQINYLLTASESNNSVNKIFLSPKGEPGLKLLSLKKSKSKLIELKEKLCHLRIQKRKLISKKKIKIVKAKNLELNLDEQQNKKMKDLPRHTYNNLKINLTTESNNINMIQHNIKKNYSVNNINNSSVQYSAYRKKYFIPKKINRINNIKVKNIENNECNTLEEVHFLLVKSIQNSKNMMISIDKK